MDAKTRQGGSNKQPLQEKLSKLRLVKQELQIRQVIDRQELEKRQLTGTPEEVAIESLQAGSQLKEEQAKNEQEELVFSEEIGRDELEVKELENLEEINRKEIEARGKNRICRKNSQSKRGSRKFTFTRRHSKFCSSTTSAR